MDAVDKAWEAWEAAAWAEGKAKKKAVDAHAKADKAWEAWKAAANKVRDKNSA